MPYVREKLDSIVERLVRQLTKAVTQAGARRRLVGPLGGGRAYGA